MRLPRRFLAFLPVLVTAVALAIPAASPAATVVNGNFETGSLSGWQVYNSTEAGDWFTYSVEEAEEEEFFFPPPQGTWAAVTDEESPDTAILYQDIALEPLYSHRLTMTFYYHSWVPIRVPNPDTLSVTPAPPPEVEGGPTQQQVRVDVMKPSAPIESLNPGDILATLFANRNGDPQTLAPIQLSADLTPFAGQTVRLRIANAVNDEPFNVGVDAVSITSAPLPPPAPPSNVFTKGKLKLNKKNGTGTLSVTVPGAGVLTLTDASSTKKATASKRKPKLVKPATLKPAAAGQVKVPLKPTGAGKKILKKKGKLKIKATLSFTPTGGTAATQSLTATLKLKRK
jgi:hypothetical protein